MGRIDLSWIIGLLITSPAYYWLAKRSQSRAKADSRAGSPDVPQYAPGESQS